MSQELVKQSFSEIQEGFNVQIEKYENFEARNDLSSEDIHEYSKITELICNYYSDTLDFLTLNTEVSTEEVRMAINLLVRSHRIIQKSEADIDRKFWNKYRLANVLVKYSVITKNLFDDKELTNVDFLTLIDKINFIRTASLVLYNLSFHENAYLWVKYLKTDSYRTAPYDSFAVLFHDEKFNIIVESIDISYAESFAGKLRRELESFIKTFKIPDFISEKDNKALEKMLVDLRLEISLSSES